MTGGGETTHLFKAGNLRFVFVTSNVEDRVLLESLFSDLRASSTGSDHEVAAFAFLRESANRPKWLVGGALVPANAPTDELSTALAQLMAALNRAALDAQPECLHLHAAAAVRSGEAVVIAAKRNTGKTTTVATLLERGWDFLTDEMVALGSDTAEIRGFPKPLSIKPHGSAHVKHLASALVPSAVEKPDPTFRFVAASADGAAVGTVGAPRLVVLLSRDEEKAAEPELGVQRLHPADAVVRLMQETLDAERYGPAAARLAALTAACLCFEVRAGTPQETADVIEELFALERPEAVPILELPASSILDPQVLTLVIDGRAVVHDLRSGHIFALDPAGTQVWEKLGGWEAHPLIDVTGPGVAPLVAQLDSLGVLENSNA